MPLENIGLERSGNNCGIGEGRLMEALQLLLQALRGHNRRHLLLLLIRGRVAGGGAHAASRRGRTCRGRVASTRDKGRRLASSYVPRCKSGLVKNGKIND